jgi:hypothetical protein
MILEEILFTALAVGDIDAQMGVSPAATRKRASGLQL